MSAPSHPFVAALLALVMYPLKKVRHHLVPEARGEVLEVGVGVGLNFGLYRDVTRIYGVDPDPHMLRRARARAAAQRLSVELIEASAEALPYPNGRFDTVVATWVLCTVADPERAVAEMYRVLRPGGTLVFAEHTRSGHRLFAWLQDLLSPLWSPCCGGCSINRDTVPLLAQHGFDDVQVRPFGRERWTLSPVYGGTARRAAAANALPRAQAS